MGRIFFGSQLASVFFVVVVIVVVVGSDQFYSGTCLATDYFPGR